MAKRSKEERRRAKEQRKLERASGRKYGTHAESSPMGIAVIGGAVLLVGAAGYFAVKYGFKALDKRKK